MGSQTRDTVDVNVFVSSAVKAREVDVKASAEDVCIRVKGEPVFKGEWPYKVAPEEDPDWEIRDFEGRRAIRLTVRKPPLPGGLTIVTWWISVFKGDPMMLHRRRGYRQKFQRQCKAASHQR